MTRRDFLQKLRSTGIFVGALCVGGCFGSLYTENSLEHKTTGAILPGLGHLTDTAAEALEEADEKASEEDLPDDWNLILVNRTHPIPSNYKVDLVGIGDGHEIDKRAYANYTAMIQAAKAERIYIYVTSAYRDMEKQASLYHDKIETLMAEEGYSYEKAQEKAAQVVAIPGTSEHHLGLALDLVSSEYRKLDEKQENTKGFKWLSKNCQDYGFILRYPNGDTKITGIIYEPWHFRYVGKKAAQEIMRKGITLEEYVGAIPVSEGLKSENTQTVKR